MSFDRLTPALQYQIANTLGFAGLRPVQEQSIETILDGKNAVVLAPTAGGKTEAAFFPLLSAMDAEDWEPVSVLYLSPIRALLNNQAERLARYAGLIGRRTFKWHGDVKSTERGRFLRDPADILLTTPESLEAMLMSTKVPTRELFSGLRAVVIDEVHAFADDDRGAHLASILERLTRFCGRDVQRIGLSATVGNPDEILRWVAGSSKREGAVVDPGGERAAADLSLDFVGTMENAAQVIQALHPGRKRLVFVDSRRAAETLGHLLNQLGVLTYVTHGSLSVSERRDAERAFETGRDTVIVATSALELGIDIGDLDHVLQIDSPNSVASFLQRMGRTGRREGTTPNCTFLATRDSALLQAAALIQLYREGFVEPIQPSRRASHILAHQLMSLCIQLGGAPPGDWWAWLDGATSFTDLGADERAGLVKHMLDEEILADQGGRLWLGPKGEHVYGRANFRKLYAVFDTPRLITVRWNTREIGQVDASFLAAIDSDKEQTAFTLAGKPWEIIEIEWQRGLCAVRPAPHGRAARWGGSGRFLSYELCQSMRRVLISDEVDPCWSQRAQNTLRRMRAEHEFLADSPSPMIEAPEEITWWTFAGGAANLLLAKVLEVELGPSVVASNMHIRFKEDAGKSLVGLWQVIEGLREAGRPDQDDAFRHAEGAARHPISKFQPCLPDKLLQDLIVERLLDLDGSEKALAT